MPTAAKYYISSILILLAVALTSWSIWVSRATSLPTSYENVPDMIFKNAITTIYNQQGSPVFKLASPLIRHYASNDTTLFETPSIVLYKPSASPWYVNADHAIATQSLNKISLLNHVKINHPADSFNPLMVLETSALTLHPDKKIASTDHPLTVIQPDLTVHAIGMVADLESNTIKLLSQAQGDYVPHH